MSNLGDIEVRFWGVRGSIASPGPATVRYGGNTSCIEVRCGEHLIIFDAGTGLRPLGLDLCRRDAAIDADLFFSHTHIDHIYGLPFFSPCFTASNSIRLWAGHLLPDRTLAETLRLFMAPPLFPVPPEAFSAAEFIDFRCGDTLMPKPGIILHTAPLNHPGGATGYRLEYGGRVVAYLTDTEHRPGELDPMILKLAAHADLMIYDSTYTDEEYPGYAGWGHSTWQEGIRLAQAAGAQALAIFHHDPSHDDAFMDRVAAKAEAMRPGTLVAREGMVVRLPYRPMEEKED